MELYTSHGAIISTAMLLVSDSILGKLYTYTPDGIRSSKTVNGTKTEYLLNGTQILAQKTGSDVMWFFYDSTGTRIGVQQGNVTAYYMYNLQGDVVGLADAATGKIIAKYLYDAWGKCVSVENADGYTIGTANPFRYRGYYYDNDTGLYYLQSRYYDPEVGRFINADGFVTTDVLGLLSSNMFVYCENNPICKTDISGEATVSIFADLNADFLIGADIGLGLSFDDHGNVAIQWYYSHPFDEETRSIGLFDIGISAQFQITECETVDDLNGISSSSGFSVGSGLYAGVDITSNKGTVDTVRNPENVKGGFKAYVGYGAGVDVHEQQTRTSTLAKFSLKSIWRSIMDFLF